MKAFPSLSRGMNYEGEDDSNENGKGSPLMMGERQVKEHLIASNVLNI